MTVKDLIEALFQYPENLKVYIPLRNGFGNYLKGNPIAKVEIGFAEPQVYGTGVYIYDEKADLRDQCLILGPELFRRKTCDSRFKGE